MRPLLILFGAMGLAFAGAASCGDAFTAPPSGDGGGGSSVGQPCDSVADCGSPSSACVNITCQVNRCVETALGDGPLPDGQQKAGDCKRLSCKNGSVQESPNSDDLPYDGNDCTSDVCSDDGPSNPLLPVDTPCGSGDPLKCDSEGNCKGCTSAGQCGTSDACVTFTCLPDQTCAHQFVQNGTPLDGSSQTAGDCKQLVCNGAGMTVSVPDANDAPDSIPLTCTQNICVGDTPALDTILDGSNCVESSNRVCCAAICCAQGETCGGNGCVGGAGGAGGA